MSERPNDFTSGESVLEVFRKGSALAKELVEDNEHLRQRVNSLEQRLHQAAGGPDDWCKLREELCERVADLESENSSILERLRSVESENQQFAGHFVEKEEADRNLANLYVASFQLHSTLDPSEVLRVVVEIVISLIGAEIFCVYLYDEKTGALEPMVSEGHPPSSFPRGRIGEGTLGRSVESGEVFCDDMEKARPSPLEGGDPIVCIPLRVDKRAVGAIAIYALLQPKKAFSVLDQELFNMLSGHAAISISASRMFSQSERKLNTIQGFIDLVTK